MGKRTSAAAAAKLTQAEAKVALAARKACTAAAFATHAARVAKATSVAATLAARVYVPTKALPYVAPVDVSAAREVARLARAASLQAVLAMRAMRMADARIAAIKARAAKALATPAFVVPALVAEVHTVVEEGFSAWHRAFLAQVAMYVPVVTKARTCATTGLSLDEKVYFKAMRLGARRGATKAPTPRVPMNDEAKRASITMACANARATKAAKHVADAHAIALVGSVMSQRTIDARAAQGAAQKAANATRKAATPAKVARPHVVIVRSGPTKNKGAKRVRVLRVHTVESIAANAARKAAIIKAKEDKEIAIVKAKEDAQIAKAKKWALRKEAYAARKAAMEVIASDAWMLKGVWLSEDLIRAANDWSYQVRIAAFKEARAIAYPPKTKAVATTGVAA